MRLKSSASQTQLAPVAERKRAIGEMFGLNPKSVEDVLQRQRETNQPFEEALIELGLATPEVVQAALEENGEVLSAATSEFVDIRVIAAANDHPQFLDQLQTVLLSLESAVPATLGKCPVFAVVGVDLAVECALISANLSVVCARKGYNVLLVDANIEHPIHDSLFHVSNSAGVSNLLASDEIPREHIQPTAIPGLSVLAAGPSLPNATALLDRERLVHRLMLSASDYDIILVDCGALSVQLATRAAVGADGAILAARAGSSSVRHLRELVNLLDLQQIHPSGVIMLAA